MGKEDNKIKQLRSLTGMTQQQFSDYLNIPKRTIENWETGQHTPAEWAVQLIEYKIDKESNNKK